MGHQHLLDRPAEDLLKGVAVRKPALARSGFYVDAAGSVLTTTQAIDACDRITLDGGIEARVAARDDALGLGLLTPAIPLAPPAFAQFRDTKGRSGAEIAVTGYSYAEALTAYDLAAFPSRHAALTGHFDQTAIAEIAAVVINMNVWTRLKLAQGAVPVEV